MPKATRPRVLYLDQYGNKFFARTVKELHQQIGGKISKMYVDKTDGTTKHVGYVIGQRWLTAHAPIERPA